jgi:hypothetical protein
MADWNDPATWARAYTIQGGHKDKADSILPTGAGFGEDLSYLDGRKFQLQMADDGAEGLSHLRFRLNKLGAVPAWTPATTVIIVGCGFGWLLEVLQAIGSNQAWGTELSTLIHANIATADVPQAVQDRVLNIDITDADAADQFQAAGAGNNNGLFRQIVTEQFLEDWPIGDMDTILDACDALRAPGQGAVTHIVSTTDSVAANRMGDDGIIDNKLSLAEWVALRPSHWWMDISSGAIGGGQ